MNTFKLLFTFFVLLSSLNLFAVEFSATRHYGVVLINGKAFNSSTILKVGDTLQASGKKSFIQIKTDLGSVFLIRNGEMKLEKFNSEESSVNLISGKFFHFFNKKTHKRKFQVKTRHAIMGVRGTKYMISTSAKEDYLCVCSGKVSAKKNDEKKEYIVGVNEDLFFYSSDKPSHKQSATKQMVSMTSGEFDKMGFPVN